MKAPTIIARKSAAAAQARIASPMTHDGCFDRGLCVGGISSAILHILSLLLVNAGIFIIGMISIIS
jgi:hypothetical protein